MSGKTDGIRKIVSTALGNGLLGQMVENPIHAADSFGVDLNQFGLNKTLLEDSLKIKPPQIHEFPTLPTVGLIQLYGQTTTTAATEPPAPEPVFVDGQQVFNEDLVLGRILGPRYGQRNPNQQPRTNPDGRRMIQRGAFRQAADYDDYGEPRRRFRGGPANQRGNPMHPYIGPTAMPETTTTQPPTTTTAILVDMDKVVKPTLDVFEKVWSVMSVPSVPPTVVNPVVPVTNPSDKENIDKAIEDVKSGTREIRRSSPNEINEMMQKIDKLQEQLTVHEELISRDAQKQKKSKRGRELSQLQKHLRHAPSYEQDDLRLETHPLPNVTEGSCECIPVELEKLHGRWSQALSSPNLTTKAVHGLQSVLDNSLTEKALSCSSIEVTPVRKTNEVEYVHLVWTIQIAGSPASYRIHGNIIATDNNVLVVRLVDFNGNLIDRTMCALKTSISSSSTYEYAVITSTEACNEATLLVQDPTSFFSKGDNELTYFLQHKISMGEMDKMDTVDQDMNCQRNT